MRTAALALLLGGVVAGQTFQAGFGRVDMTPRKPAPLWGYGTGSRPQFVSTGVRDALEASALVVEAGGKRLAIVGLDLGRAPTRAMLERIRAGARVDAVIVNGSHTHHAPVIELLDEAGKGKGAYDGGVEFNKELPEKIVAAIAKAAADLRPARYGWASVELPLNRNRHSKLEPKPIDRELVVLRFDALDGKPIAVAVNWAAHPTSIDPKDVRISADYPGALRQALERKMGCGSVFLQGAAGDMSTNRGEMDYAAYGARLGEEAARLAAGIQTRAPEKPGVQFSEERFDFASRVDFTNAFFLTAMDKNFFPELVSAIKDELAGNRVRPTLAVALLNGELAIVGVSGEPFAAHSLRLKQRSRAARTILLGYTNDHQMYFPTIEGAAEGGYGGDASVAWVEVGGPERMMDRALITIYRFLGKLR